MPIELDFWAENLNRSHRKKEVIASNQSDTVNQKTSSKTFSIFEDR